MAPPDFPGSLPGTYVLLLSATEAFDISVGKLGTHSFLQGWYLYVGSAFGPGGVAARCRHHHRISLNPRWHIDYLRARCDLCEIWFTHDSLHREHAWAAMMTAEMGFSPPVHKFGASDCDCGSHLFYSAVKPDWTHFRKLVTSGSGRDKAFIVNLCD